MPQIPTRANTAAQRSQGPRLQVKDIIPYLTNKKMVDNTVPHFHVDHPNGDYGIIPIDEMRSILQRISPINRYVKINDSAEEDEKYRLTTLSDYAKKLGYGTSGNPGMTGQPLKNLENRIQKYFTEGAMNNDDYQAWKKDPNAFANRTKFRANSQVPELSRQIAEQHAKGKK